MKKKLNYFACLMLTVLLGAGQVKALDGNLTPEILIPDPQSGALLYGLSDNGDWGVSCVSPGYDGFSDFAGASIYDLRSNPVKSVDLKANETYAAGFDVTDDGRLVVGSVRQKPAVCRLQDDGTWQWTTLPTPDRKITIRNEFTGYVAEYTLNGGEVYNVTPDGRYAVGAATSIEYINIEVGCMWDLETMELMELPGLGLETSTFSRLTQISADGRYVVGRKGGYFIYDRQTRTSKSARVGLDIYAQGMSNNAKYMSGVTRRNDVPYASFWDIDANSLTVLEDDIYGDAVAWTITNDGVPLIARPYITPYADAYVYYDGFLYSFEELLTQVYGMDLAAYGLDITGKPFKVSSDGRTMVFITGIGESYVLRLKEHIGDAVSRIDLYKNWKALPENGTRMTSVSTVTFTFNHEVELVGRERDIVLVDDKGAALARPKTNGVTFSGTSMIIQFSDIPMEAGKKYTVRIPQGTIKFIGRKEMLNPELAVTYEGRENVPVKPVRFNPEPGSSLSSLSLADNPVSVVFDEMIALNFNEGAQRPVAKVYIDGEEDLVGFCNLDVDLYTGNTLVVFPDNTIPLYKGSNYSIVIPEGAVVDRSGTGANERFVISYSGSLVPQLGDDKYLFRSGCDDYTNFLFYEGDHGIPLSEYRNMGFTQDETPWHVVRDDDYSTDMAFASHSGYTTAMASDDWVATRQILIPEDAKPYLAFDSQSYRKAKKDYLKVIVYENPALINAFNSAIVDDIRANGKLVYNELQSPGANEGIMAGEWTHNVIDLSEYAGKSIYICFLNDNYNQSMVMIDNIEVVNNLSAFITLRNQTNVVDQDDIAIRGMVSISGETSSFSSIEMTLKDADGNEISEIRESGLNLREGDLYNFEFPQALPLRGGEVNKFTISYALGEDSFSYEGAISNLAFEPETHVVLEEFTGRGCVYCPGGIVTIEHLESLYGNKVIPVALHCYEGTDPKGRNVMDYASYLGMGAAPMARINRGPVASPLMQTPSGYTNTGTGDEKLWKDLVIEALGNPALIEIDVQPVDHTASTLNYEVCFKSALRLEDTHYRVFGVLLEDGLVDYQSNAYYSQSDPLLGEWGAGGMYGLNTVYYVFDNVARGTWGSSYSGTPGLLPSDWNVGSVYKVDISMPVPDIVENTEKCRLVVMLIDETTGRVVNASRSDIRTVGIDAVEVGDDAEDAEPVYYDLTGRRIANPAKGQLVIERRGSKVSKIIK